MLQKLYRFIISRGSLPVLLTLAAAVVVAGVLGSISLNGMLQVLAVGGFQSFLLVYQDLFDRSVPIERLDRSNRLPAAGQINAVALGLSLVPLSGLIAPWLGWVVIALAAALFSKSLFVLLQRMLKGRRMARAALEDLEAGRPLVAVYVSGLADVAYQVNQWLPVMERLGLPVIVVARQREIFDGMPATGIPVFYARNMAHVEKLLLCGVRTVLYPANTMHNVQALRQFHLNHFFINHGESDKAVNQSKLLQAYDKLLVAGPLAHRRLIDAGLALRSDQVEYVGRPQAELLLEQQDAPAINGKLRVLYAPTWEGFVDNVDYSSVGSMGIALLRSLAVSDDVEVVFKPHPYTGSRKFSHQRYLADMKRYCEQSGIKVVESLSSIYECMNNSDLLITDVSSVLNDYLVTRKPVILCENNLLKELDVDEQFPSARAAYKLRAGEEALALVQSVRREDSLARAREEVRKDSLGDLPGGAMEKFTQVVKESVSDAVQ